MELFALDDEVARLQELVEADACSLAQRLSLAWHMRQRNSNSALSLAHQVHNQLQQQPDLPLQLRLDLLFGEIHWLQAELTQADNLAAQVLQQASHEPVSQAFLIVQADAWWLRGWLYFEQGQEEARDHAWQTMQQLASTADDAIRQELATVCLAAMQCFRAPNAEQALADHYLASDLESTPVAVRAAVFDFLGLQVRLGSNSGMAGKYWMQSFELAQRSGQIRRAIVAACNIGESFSILHDHEINLQWLERALALARRNNWPGTIGTCLARTAACLRKLGRNDSAYDMLEEALQAMQALAGSRNHSNALLSKADMQVERQELSPALASYAYLYDWACQQKQGDIQIYVCQGKARCLSQMQRASEALHCAELAFSLGQQHDNLLSQVTTLQLLAKLHHEHNLPVPADVQANTVQLHYLQQAYNMAKALGGLPLSGDLLNEIAQAHASAGDYAQAYAYAQEAIAAHQRIHHDAITKRASAIELQHKAERNRIEAEHLRQLAQEQAQRAQMLQDANATLANLGAIGQEITAQLDLEAVFSALKGHVKNMLPTSYMALLLCDHEGTSLSSIFRQQGEENLPTLHIDLNDVNSYTAQCVRERRELEVAKARGEPNPSLSKDAKPTLSALFGPLIIGQRILGVMTIQSEEEYVYGERERLIFRSLCAYGAIALANAHAYQQLQEAQQQLVAQEKLAALGVLVAGVAHELNTPLGNGLVAISGLQDRLSTLATQLAQQNLRASDLHSFVADAQELSALSLRNLHRAAKLVSNFKQIATKGNQQEIQRFNLLQVTRDVIDTLHQEISAEKHVLRISIAAEISLLSYPGAYGQVLSSLLSNTLTHAFAPSAGGEIEIRAVLHKNKRVHIFFRDNGLGIAQQHVKYIFDPFFTTRLGQGGNGLGLSICYNIVTSMLEGQISVTSASGQFTEFLLDLPLQLGLTS